MTITGSGYTETKSISGLFSSCIRSITRVHVDSAWKWETQNKTPLAVASSSAQVDPLTREAHKAMAPSSALFPPRSFAGKLVRCGCPNNGAASPPPPHFATVFQLSISPRESIITWDWKLPKWALHCLFDCHLLHLESQTATGMQHQRVYNELNVDYTKGLKDNSFIAASSLFQEGGKKKPVG